MPPCVSVWLPCSAPRCAALQGLTQISSLQLDNSWWRPLPEVHWPSVDGPGEEEEEGVLDDEYDPDNDLPDPEVDRFSGQQYDQALRPLTQVATDAAARAAGAVCCCVCCCCCCWRCVVLC